MSRWDKIRQKCPKLYRNGIIFECAHGWYDIIDELSVKIENILEKYENDDMYAIQVKEKYGTLRFYMSCETNEIVELIDEAEALSSQVCETCGAPAKMRGVCWIEVKCDKCFGGTK